MPIVDLSPGSLFYSVAGPDSSTEPAVVFLHGLLVNHELWSRTADALAQRGIRSYAPDLPLGAHTIAMKPDFDNTPRAAARLIIEFLESLDLEDVTLVGNDTGGALCQFVLDTDHSRVGRVVLTNCDAFDKFPPPPFGMLKFGSSPRRAALMMRSVRPKFLRHSMLGYGGLSGTKLDPEMTARWARPCTVDKDVARDTAKFLASIDKRELLDVSTRLGAFAKPVHLVWGDADRFFKIAFAQRLAATFPDATLIRVRGGRTFIPLDEPDQVAAAIAAAGH